GSPEPPPVPIIRGKGEIGTTIGGGRADPRTERKSLSQGAQGQPTSGVDVVSYIDRVAIEAGQIHLRIADFQAGRPVDIGANGQRLRGSGSVQVTQEHELPPGKQPDTSDAD